MAGTSGIFTKGGRYFLTPKMVTNGEISPLRGDFTRCALSFGTKNGRFYFGEFLETPKMAKKGREIYSAKGMGEGWNKKDKNCTLEPGGF